MIRCCLAVGITMPRIIVNDPAASPTTAPVWAGVQCHQLKAMPKPMTAWMRAVTATGSSLSSFLTGFLRLLRRLGDRFEEARGRDDFRTRVCCVMVIPSPGMDARLKSTVRAGVPEGPTLVGVRQGLMYS